MVSTKNTLVHGWHLLSSLEACWQSFLNSPEPFSGSGLEAFAHPILHLLFLLLIYSVLMGAGNGASW